MRTLKITFKPEQRKINGILRTEDVAIVAILNCNGRTFGLPKLRLFEFDDFDIKAQKIKSGKKVKQGSLILSASQGNAHLEEYSSRLFNAKRELEKIDENYTVLNILHKAFPPRKKQLPAPIVIIKEDNMASHILNKVKIWEENKVMSSIRIAKYYQLSRMISRFNILLKNELFFKTASFQDLIQLSEFIKDEYLYKRSHPELFIKEKIHDKPKSKNTLAIFMKLLNGFFLDLKIENPLNEDMKVSQKIRKEQYLKDKIKLTIDELLHCVKSDYPIELKVERDSFLYQCALGQRVNDFYNTAQYDIQYNGKFHYIHYDPSKTNLGAQAVEIVETPLIKYAVDILLDNNMVPPIRNYKSSELTSLYNQRIKLLLKHWGITREVIIKEGDEIKRVPLWEMASNKLARSTFVDIINKSQINPYLAGLHKDGSSAVNHYTSMDLEERWRFFSMAFRQELY